MTFTAHTDRISRTGAKLFAFSIGLGLAHLFKACFTGARLSLRESIKRIVIPMDIGRYFELTEIVDDLRDEERVLDLSSPKLAAFYGASRHPTSTYIALDRFKREIVGWAPLRDTSSIRNLDLMIADMTRLPFKTGVFDRVFSVSVIEHLPGDLDLTALQEIYRVLKPGGRFQMTTPFAKKTFDVFDECDIYSEDRTARRTFFYRFYDPELYEKKFRAPFAWKAIDERLGEERHFASIDLFGRLAPFSYLSGPILGLVAFFNLRVRKYEPDKPPLRRSELYACYQKPLS